MSEKSQHIVHEAVDDDDSIENMYLTFEVDT